MNLRSTSRRLRPAFTPLVAVCLLAVSYSARAIPLDDWAVAAATAAYDCTGQTALLCTLTTPVPPVLGPENGGVMQSSASSSVNAPALGNASSSASLDVLAGFATPSLAAGAFSTATDGGAFGTAFAAEAYTNTTAVTQTYTLDFLLHAIVNDPTTANIPFDLGTAVTASGFVVKAASALYSFDADFATVVADLQALSLISPEVYATDLLTALSDPGVDQNLQDSITFDLAPGESAYAVAHLSAQAMRDNGSADATSTFSLAFRDSTGLVSTSNTAVVAEPGPLGLVVLGGLLTIAIGRRRSP